MAFTIDLTGETAVKFAIENELTIVQSSRGRDEVSLDVAKELVEKRFLRVGDGDFLSLENLFVTVPYTPTKWAAYGDTYPVKDQLRSLGGRWNKERRQWEFDSEPATSVEGVAFAPTPLPNEFHCGYGYAAAPGKVFVRPLALRDRETKEFKRESYHVSLATWFVKGFDPIDDPSTDATLSRPVTDEEWAEILAKREATKHRQTARDSFVKLVHATGDTPKEAALPADRIEWPRRSQPDYLARDEEFVYLAHYNGADGDDWSYNNWGSRVLWVAPRTAELDAAYDAAAATFGEQ